MFGLFKSKKKEDEFAEIRGYMNEYDISDEEINYLINYNRETQVRRSTLSGDEPEEILQSFAVKESFGLIEEIPLYEFVINNYIKCEGHNEWLFQQYKELMLRKIDDKELINRIKDKFGFKYKKQAKDLNLTITKIESLYRNWMQNKDYCKGFYLIGHENYRSRDFTWDEIQEAVKLIVEDNTRSCMLTRD